jgi:hypothetical protein
LAERFLTILVKGNFIRVITHLLLFLSLRVRVRHSLMRAGCFLRMKRLRSLFIPIRLRRRGIFGSASASPPIAPLLAMTDFFIDFKLQNATFVIPACRVASGDSLRRESFPESFRGRKDSGQARMTFIEDIKTKP